MPIEDGSYCQYCTDENGNLQKFKERLERMSQFMLARQKASTVEEARMKAALYMSDMPAWRDNLTLREFLKENGL